MLKKKKNLVAVGLESNNDESRSGQANRNSYFIAWSLQNIRELDFVLDIIIEMRGKKDTGTVQRCSQ